MLIRSIRAENFMRFSRLDISELPARGLIGIEGPNESGKSTVGEALLFVFFGKTRYSANAPVTSLIRWDADSTHVEVEFSIRSSGGAGGRSDGDFLIFRQIDRYGTNYVKLLELPSRNEIAAGNHQVAQFISKRLRFDFLEFQQSFYSDQYESRKTQVEQASFFESATGVNHLQQALVDLGTEVEPLENEFSFYQKEIARNLVQIEQYGRNAAKLPDLALRVAKIPESTEAANAKVEELELQVEALRGGAAHLEARGKLIDKLQGHSVDALPKELEKILDRDGSPSVPDVEGSGNGLRASQDRLQKLHSFFSDVAELRSLIHQGHQDTVLRLDGSFLEGPVAEKAHLTKEATSLGKKAGTASVLAVLSLILAALTGFSAFAEFSDAFAGVVPEPWRSQALPILVGATLLLLFGGAGLLARASRLRKRRREAGKRCEDLNAEILNLHKVESESAPLLELQAVGDVARLITGAEGSSVAGAAKAASDLGKQHAALLDGDDRKAPDPGGLEKTIASLSKANRDLRSRVLSEAGKVERAQNDAEGAVKKLKTENDRIEAEVRECKSQATRKEALEEKNSELEASGAEIREAIDVRLLARRLIEEAIHTVRSKIGPSLTRFVKSILPRLTSGRYRDVRVEDDLEIKVFSSEKNDFLSRHELSGGTNEALMLALRLAISHCFVSSRIRQEQFVFLDESFQMMDPEKVALTLRLLPLLSPDLEQFFVVQTEFDEKQRELLDKVLRTSIDVTELSVTCGSSGSANKGRAASRPADLDRAGQDPSPHVLEA